MAYVDIHSAATDPDHVLRKQVIVSCQKAATDILNEAAGTENHGQRLQWSRKILRSGGAAAEGEKMIWEVLANAAIQAAPTNATDNDVQFVVNSLLNTFAGE